MHLSANLKLVWVVPALPLEKSTLEKSDTLYVIVSSRHSSSNSSLWETHLPIERTWNIPQYWDMHPPDRSGPVGWTCGLDRSDRLLATAAPPSPQLAWVKPAAACFCLPSPPSTSPGGTAYNIQLTRIIVGCLEMPLHLFCCSPGMVVILGDVRNFVSLAIRCCSWNDSEETQNE